MHVCVCMRVYTRPVFRARRPTRVFDHQVFRIRRPFRSIERSLTEVLRKYLPTVTRVASRTGKKKNIYIYSRINRNRVTIVCARIYVLFRSRDHFFHLLPFALFYFNFRFILGLDRETVHVRRFRKTGYERNLYYNFMNKSSESLFKVFDSSRWNKINIRLKKR